MQTGDLREEAPAVLPKKSAETVEATSVAKASGRRIKWKQAPGTMLVTGGMAYEVGSNVFTSAPAWLWPVVGGTLALPDVYKAVRKFLGYEETQ